MSPIKATYVSVWDDSTAIESPCVYDPMLNVVYDIQQSNVDVSGLEVLTDEYVEFENGDRISDFLLETDLDDYTYVSKASPKNKYIVLYSIKKESGELVDNYKPFPDSDPPYKDVFDFVKALKEDPKVYCWALCSVEDASEPHWIKN